MDPSKRVSVLLDAGPIVHQQAGLNRYASQLATHLWRNQQNKVDLQLFHNDHRGHELPLSLQDVPGATLPMGQYRWRLSVLALQMLNSYRYERVFPPTDIYHATEHLLPRLSRRTVMTVHDLIFKRLPQTHTWKNRAFLSTGMPIFLQKANAIIAVSAQTKRDLEDIYEVEPSRVTVIPEGIDENFRQVPADDPDSRDLRKRLGLYFLMVGTLEPRKNHAAVLRALAYLRSRGHVLNLVIAGGQGWKFSPVQSLVTELGLQSQVQFAGFVPEELLPAYYSNAVALLQPSLYEGFGFPVLEAMACGAPVVISNRSCLPELAGPNALVVDPDDIHDLGDAMLRLSQQAGLREDLRAKGLQHARQFTWAETSRQTVELYLSLL